jgi:predicted NodU family carbamoyl transferase
LQNADGVPKYADGMSGSYLGPKFSEAEIAAAIKEGGWIATRVEPDQVADIVGEHLASERVVGPDAGPHGVRPPRARRPFDPR